MPNQERRWLIASIRNKLLPALHSQGFETLALTDQEKAGDLPSGYPFGRLRRVRVPSIDVAEIQLERRGIPAFCISAGVVPAGGISHPAVGHVPAEQLWSSHLPQHYVFYQIPFLERWFSLWHWPRRLVSPGDVASLVDHVTATVIPEIEDALRHGRSGKHVKKFGR